MLREIMGSVLCREVFSRYDWFLSSLDNPALQDDVLHFISTVLVLDHPRLCKHLRTNILAIKVRGLGLGL